MAEKKYGHVITANLDLYAAISFIAKFNARLLDFFFNKI